MKPKLRSTRRKLGIAGSETTLGELILGPSRLQLPPLVSFRKCWGVNSLNEFQAIGQLSSILIMCNYSVPEIKTTSTAANLRTPRQ